MKARLTFLLLFTAATIAGQPALARVRAHLAADDLKRAEALADSCYRADHHADSALFYKAVAKVRRNDTKGAKKVAALLPKIYPQFHDVDLLNGLIYFHEENYGRSIESFSAAIKRDPRHLKALFNRSIAYGILEDYLAAIEDLEACIHIDPGFSQAYYAKAYWYEFTGNYAEAQKDYEHSIRLDPKNFDAYYGLAFIYRNQRETVKACEILNQAITAGSQIAEDLKSNYCR
jgi:tetratricopeptide (TPR) repeat protein